MSLSYADFCEQIRTRVTARQVAEAEGFKPDRNAKILCPFHNEETPSCQLNEDGTFHCYGCGTHGSSLDFKARIAKSSIRDAAIALNRDFNLGLVLQL